MNVNWMRWTMAMQVLFFVGWAGAEEYSRVDAVEFVLETRPVDPRDFLSGLYMTLGYRFMDPEGSVPGGGSPGEVGIREGGHGQRRDVAGVAGGL